MVSSELDCFRGDLSVGFDQGSDRVRHFAEIRVNNSRGAGYIDRGLRWRIEEIGRERCELGHKVDRVSNERTSPIAFLI